MKKKVKKGLTPEQKTALENAKALISQIESMEMGEGQEDSELEEAYKMLNEKEQMGEQPEGDPPRQGEGRGDQPVAPSTREDPSLL